MKKTPRERKSISIPVYAWEYIESTIDGDEIEDRSKAVWKLLKPCIPKEIK